MIRAEHHAPVYQSLRARKTIRARLAIQSCEAVKRPGSADGYALRRPRGLRRPHRHPSFFAHPSSSSRVTPAQLDADSSTIHRIDNLDLLHLHQRRHRRRPASSNSGHTQSSSRATSIVGSGRAGPLFARRGRTPSAPHRSLQCPRAWRAAQPWPPFWRPCAPPSRRQHHRRRSARLRTSRSSSRRRPRRWPRREQCDSPSCALCYTVCCKSSHRPSNPPTSFAT